MNFAAIKHESLLLFRQPVARHKVRFRLLTARDDLSECRIIYWKRSEPERRWTQPLMLRAQDQTSAEWLAEVTRPEEIHYLKYFFFLKDRQGGEAYYCEHGFSEQEPQRGFFELLQVNPGDVPCPPEWARGLVYYQIFPERFCRSGLHPNRHPLDGWNAWPTRENYLGGDLAGIRQKLPYLQELGAECLYLTPIFAADFNHKYATTDYFAIDPDFGTEDELTALVQEAHSRGIRILLDGVFNHSGVHFAPFQDLMAQGETSRYRDWFFPKRFPIATDAACYECVGDYPYMPRLNTGNPEVQDFVLSVMRYWIQRCGVDGWRMDVADELDTACVQFLRRRLKAEFPQALLLGETWGDATRMLCGGDQFDSVMNYLFRDCMVDYFAHGAIDERQLDERLQHMRMKYLEETSHYLYNCLSSHDTARFLTEARGEKWRLKLALAFQMLYPGCPALYYGEEIGMEGENDPGCRGGMAWERQDEELLGWVKELIRFRRRHEAVRRGAYRTLLADPDKKLFAFERRTDGETITVIFNSGDQPQDFAAEAGTIPVHAVKIIPS